MEFVVVENPEKLLPILESRLPKSAHSYNMVVMSPKFQKEMKIYVLNGEISDKSCIVIIHRREDYAHEMNVSVPEDFEITTEIKNLFAFSKVLEFDWDQTYMISAVERTLTPMFLEISAFIKGNAVSLNPCYLYYMDREEASKLEIEAIPNTTVKSLEKTSGCEFLSRTWKYRIDGSEDYMRRMIDRNETSGVYVDENVVCGIITTAHGQMGMLYTDSEFRKRGFAKICIQSLMKKSALKGLVPCSTWELKNGIAASFHRQTGMKVANIVDFVVFSASGF